MSPRRTKIRTMLRRRSGMSLVEVIVAMMLLVGVVLVLGGFSAQFARAASQAHLVVMANELAATRLDAVKQQPSYSAIDSLVQTDTVSADFAQYTIRTQIVRIGGAVTDSVDYKLVTVTVTHPAMKTKVAKTTAVAAF